MDPMTLLAVQAVQIIAPALPFLLDKAGGGAAAEAGKRLGAAAWDSAQALWRKLHPTVVNDPVAQQVVTQVAAAQDDPDAAAALRFQIKSMLVRDPALAREIEDLLRADDTSRPSTVVTASGTRSVAIGGSMSGGSISTGDHPPTPPPA